MKTKKQIIAAAKTDKEPTKKNYTFRLDIGLMDSLESTCEKEGVKLTAILTELIKDFCQFGPKEK